MSFTTILQPATIELEERRSRFIATAAPCSHTEEALAELDAVRAEHKQATHHCYCYVIGENRLEQRFSDNGEPQGTAGMPMLEVLNKLELTNCCVVVTRYFGGIKLGAAGLIRAYTKACRHAVEAAEIVRYQSFERTALHIAYEHLGRVDFFLREGGYHETERRFDAAITIECLFPSGERGEIREQMMTLTNGKAGYEVFETVDCAVDTAGRIIDPAERLR